MSIKKFKPRKDKRRKTGLFVPKNPNKYLGRLDKIWFRSGLELDFYKELDLDPKVLCWEAEPERFKVNYMSPIDKKIHTYFLDAYCKKLVGGMEREFLIEVKPKSQVLPPKPPKPTGDMAVDRKRNSRYKAKKKNHIIIHEKRKAAQKMAQKMGMLYIFKTEDSIKKTS
jgi:hypothetical protein